MSRRGIVAAGDAATAEAARLMLADGGNAFDAVLAAMCAACVAEPVLASPGGGGFLLARSGGRARLYDFFAHTPRRRRDPDQVDFYPITADFGGAHQQFHIGMGSIATPGLVRGLFGIHQDLATIPMRHIVEPAIALAREGVRLSELQAYILGVVGPIYRCNEPTRATYGSKHCPGELLGAGEIWRAPELADTLELLALEGQRLFYEGEIAALLVAACQQQGGHLGAADLAGYQLERREPLTLDYHGVRLLTNPPPSCGGILIAFALRLLDHSGIQGLKFGCPEHLLLLAAVMELTNKARVDSGLEQLSPDRQRALMLDSGLLERYRQQLRGRYANLRGTTQISVVDSDGNAASMTLSNGEGCGYLIPGTGIMMNNMLGEEDINPHGFHRWPVDTRIASMMSPSLVLWPDGRVLALGSGGSNRIRTAILQVLLNRVDLGLGLEQAVQAPRLHYEQGQLDCESGFAVSTRDVLAEAFPQHRFWDGLNMFFGGAHSVELQPAGGRMSAAADPRRGGACARV